MKKFRTLKKIAAAMAAVLAIQVIPFSAMAVGDEINDTIDHEAIIDKLHTDEAENAEAQAIVAEETGMRSENEKHYRLEDGSYVAAQYPTAVHYKDENGNWVDIDNTLSFEESKSDEDFDGYTNSENSFSVKLANDAKDQLFRLNDGESSVSMKLSESAVQSSEISVENADSTAAVQSELTIEEQNEAAMSLDALTSKAEYVDVMPGVDLEYTVMPDGVKEYIVVNEKLSDYEFSFELALGDMYLRENDDNSISIMTAGGEEKYIIPAPYMTDANDRYSDAVEYTVSDMGGGVYTLTVTADAGWIEDSETAFPVRIDPTVTTTEKYTALQEDYVSSKADSADVSHNNSVESIMVGYNNSNKTTRAFIKWDNLSKLSSTYVVISAKLKYYQNGTRRGEMPIVEVHPVLDEWNAGSLTWNNQPAISDEIIDSVTVKSYAQAKYIEFDVTSSVCDYLNGSNTNGIVLKEKTEYADTSTKNTLVTLYSHTYKEQTNHPSLEIRYRAQKGLSNEYSYVPFDLRNTGTAYINAYNGEVTFVHEAISTDELNINNVFNNYMAYRHMPQNNIEQYLGFFPETLVGINWKLSIQDVVLETTEEEIEAGVIESASMNGEKAYVYNDRYGTNVYLFKDDEPNKYKDNQGLGYVLTVNGNSYTLKEVCNGYLHEKTFKILPYTTNNITRNVGYVTSYIIKNGDELIKRIQYDYANGTFLSNIYIYKGNDTTASKTLEIKRESEANPRIALILIGTQTIRFNYGSATPVSDRLMSISDSKKGTTYFGYCDNGTLASVITPDEARLEFEYNTSDGRLSKVILDDPYCADIITTSFTYDRGTTTVNYSGENADDGIILKYFFDENGSNTFAYAQNPKFGIYEKFAANGIKGIDCGAINDPENNITLYMNDDVMSGSKAFTMNSNSYEYPSVNLTTYYGDANTGDHSYKLETQTGRGTMNYIQKEVTLQPGEHTFSAYVKCINTSDANGTVSISIEDTWEDITECYDIPLSSCSNDWKKLTLDFSTTKEGIVSEEEDFARKFMLYINAKVSNDKNATILIDDITIDGKTLSYPTERNALASCGFEGIEKMRWETTNTSLNYIYADDEPENVAFGNQSVKIEGSTSREKSLYHIVYMNSTTDETKYRLSGWGKASSLPLKDDGSNGFELFAYYVYCVATKEYDEKGDLKSVTRGETKTISTAIPFDDQYDDWQYVSAELNAPKENLASNQEIQIYSITIGTLYKNNSGNAYFDNIELTPVE